MAPYCMSCTVNLQLTYMCLSSVRTCFQVCTHVHSCVYHWVKKCNGCCAVLLLYSSAHYIAMTTVPAFITMLKAAVSLVPSPLWLPVCMGTGKVVWCLKSKMLAFVTWRVGTSHSTQVWRQLPLHPIAWQTRQWELVDAFLLLPLFEAQSSGGPLRAVLKAGHF